MSQFGGLKFWHDSEALECVYRTPEAPNVMTFGFRSPSGALFNHDPGQFVTLELPVPDGPIYRVYTISSSPSRPMVLTVTVKAQDGSVGTRWMLDHLQSGMKIKAIGPAGRFSVVNEPARKYLFVSAGSGITPMVAMTTWLSDSGVEPDIVFVNAARRPSDIILRQPMELMASRTTGIDLKWVVEEADPFSAWTGYRGLISQAMLSAMAPDYLEREVFCCGPEPFMRAVRQALEALGFDMAHYHQESFSAAPDEAEDVPSASAPPSEADVEVVFAGSDKTARCTQSDTLLSVARSVAVPIAVGCTMGLCGTCKIRKIEGEVNMVHNGGITDDDVAEGFILACCSKPLGRVVLDI